MKKKMLAIILLLIGLGITIIGLGLSMNSNKISSNNKDSINENFAFDIKQFIIEKKSNDEINLKLNIKNISPEKIVSKKVYLNFYRENEIAYVYECDIVELDANYTLSIESVINFKHENITRYEFEYEGIKKNIEPIN